MKRRTVSVLLAAIATIFTYALQNWPMPLWTFALSQLANLFSIPAFLVTGILFGNPHNPDPKVMYSLVFVTYLFLIVGGWMLFDIVKRKPMD
jgi:hypothetical protein